MNTPETQPEPLPPAPGSAFHVLVDMIEDPDDNGDYRIPTKRDHELHTLYVATQKDMEDICRLRSALKDIACMAERYNYVGWQRIVGQMQKCALKALNPR